METTTEERTAGSTADDLEEEKRRLESEAKGDVPSDPGPDPGDPGPDEDADATSEEAAFAEEQRKEEERQKAEAGAKDQLSFPIGGIRPATAKIQVTGGDVEIPAHLMPDKDEELQIVCTGWVKTIADRTTKKGVSAERVAIFVVEDVNLQKLAS